MARRRRSGVTVEYALRKLLRTRALSEDILEPLRISLDTFKRHLLLDEETRRKQVDGVLKRGGVLRDQAVMLKAIPSRLTCVEAATDTTPVEAISTLTEPLAPAPATENLTRPGGR